ncbi:hypothetical protein I79_008101 [Cricetulus griseus]|uniref:Uncharacterized protein n=1 Tax=Cricetulus griseus TaxID=10029 RepID=G3HC97_CRIGR|nr:hypothetical protein I79_008101 [Cricetulus griseus]
MTRGGSECIALGQCWSVLWRWLSTSGPQTAKSYTGVSVLAGDLSPKLVLGWALSLITAAISLDYYQLVLVF